MTSQYIKCDGCGVVLDRWPLELSQGDGSFGKGGRVREYAASIGWKYNKAPLSEGGADFCPTCAPTYVLPKRE